MAHDILSEIVANKRMEIASLPPLTKQRSMRKALSESATGIISEFKRRSPSKGWINEKADPTVIVPGYEAAGATAISILADSKYFGGGYADIRAARPLVNVPILCKEFVVEESQLLQARAAGADAVLLIAACLEKSQCDKLAHTAHALGLEVLLEVHTEEELEYISPCIDMVGVNNRNLGTFHTDVANSFRIAEALREAVKDRDDIVLVSESGLSSADTLRSLREAGFRGFLMGETFMKNASPADALRTLVDSL